FPRSVPLPHVPPLHYEVSRLRIDALIRIALTIVLFAVLLRSALAGNARLRQVGHMAMCALLAGQCLLAADRQVNGPEASDFLHPFKWGDFYMARRDEFRPPSIEQLKVLHERVEPERYRVALVCDHDIADGFCAGHVPEFWR